ncbi:translation initiation factor IF-2 [Cryptococcus neoformans var. grubii H99]|uniref:Translation initiation factor IF-2, mitochondrial n=1 Tax=Cryptococcus neoformans (strain H99 / ATCC 208821 / CBS 10515 / FGSC 9487) TaxID=235443 RepID=J9VLY8_CRYN9|nr:translation initiation factor IF-2 [Cryptococcus neoformans var. grubii H99]AFR92710.2 translation initiation factor IF-2 [Cryptococcus neoformans var. grubii H99]AUB22172.1 translation initiation factor IF-2 [Cryptococcus neoformans var. grubii]|eukprot:XP_012046356.1 translation initiation factor IF-2 [Cryptococcus neoformans var. grubii H99]
MPMALTFCRCCRGLRYPHSVSSARPFSSSLVPFTDVSGSFRLPVRDWSRQTSVNGSKDEDHQGSKKGKGGMRRKKDDSGRRIARSGESNKGYGLGGNAVGVYGADSKDPFTQGLSRWGLSADERGKKKVGFGIKHPRPVYQPAGLSSTQEDRSSRPHIQSTVASNMPLEEGGDDDVVPVKRSHGPKGRKGRSVSHSLLSRFRTDDQESDIPFQKHHRRDRQNQVPQPVAPRKAKAPKPKVISSRSEKEVYIPRTISTGNLAKIFGVKLFPLQAKMMQLDMSEDQRRSDYLLSAEEACNIAIEYGYNPIVDDEASFDIYPDPDPVDASEQPLRPPVITIMGHVDHGKTTLLDSLRHTSVAASEAGGITQHIGAFSVPVSSLLPHVDPSSAMSTITFLDTPGHAAFTAMRARGASVTDIIVLVVAADDGVMPQTKEVIELAKSEGDKIGLVVAINKCDKPEVDVQKVKSALGAEGIFLEEDGGDIPSVRVSALRKTGLDALVETLSTLAEIRDLRARRDGKAEGYVLESRVDKGRGNVASVLITKGALRTGASIVAGHTWCRVRQMQDDKGKPLREALPGTPVFVTGWKDLPSAGDELLEAKSGEDEAKKAVGNRKRDEERKRLLADVEQINAKRKEERQRLEAEAAAAAEAVETGKDISVNVHNKKPEFKTLNLLIKADVSGTVEAVVGSLEHIGNKEAGVKIIHTGVGEISESDVSLAEASGATIIGFNVTAPRAIQTIAKNANVSLQLESVIYRLIDKVRSDVASLLPPTVEYSVKGEATVLQLFSINLKRKQTVTIAGCRVNNGVIDRTEGVRVLRGPERKVVYEGSIETLKHLKKDVQEVRKGMECGIALEGFVDIREADEVVTVVKVEVPREL